MIDDGVTAVVREAFRRQEYQVDGAAHGLVPAVLAKVATRRRTRHAVTAALAVIAVLAVFTGVSAVWWEKPPLSVGKPVRNLPSGRSFFTTSIVKNGHTEPVAPGTGIEVSFDAQGIVAYAGCSRMWWTSARLRDGRLVLTGAQGGTGMVCTAPGVLDQESWLFRFLSNQPKTRVAGNELFLTGSDAELHLTASPDSPPPSWSQRRATGWGTACVGESPPEPSPGSIQRLQFCNSTLDIPANPALDQCPHGQIRFDYGYARPPLPPNVVALTVDGMGYADLEHTGINDVVALIGCRVGQSDAGQVLAFKRGPGGTIQTMGRVVTTGLNTITSIDGAWGTNATGGYDGLADSVRVWVGSGRGSDEWRQWASVDQGRVYRWTGSGFVQVYGSTSFLADHTTYNLTVTAAPIVFEKPVDGNRVGHVTVTVHNLGTQPVPQVSLFAHFPNHAVDGTCNIPIPRQGDPDCPMGTIAAGGTWQSTLTLTIRQSGLDRDGNPNWSSPDGGIQLKVGDQLYTELHNFTATYS
jgi:hypothetical protein